jgi:acyl-CoA thioester hydrolase
MPDPRPTHETSFRVRYGEVDRMAVVYHAHYLVYFELGRTEFLRALGDSYARLEDEGTLLVVVETGVKHLRPARYDDWLTVRTHLSELRGVRMRFDYELVRDDTLVATGFTLLAATDRRGRPCRVPAAFRDRIRAALGVEDGKAGAVPAVQGESS